MLNNKYYNDLLLLAYRNRLDPGLRARIINILFIFGDLSSDMLILDFPRRQRDRAALLAFVLSVLRVLVLFSGTYCVSSVSDYLFRKSSFYRLTY